jgi:phytanoyl-CoA hydroxylase
MASLLRRLSKAQLSDFSAKGYLVLRSLIPQAELTALKQRAFKLIDQWQPSSTHTVFTTDDQSRKADEYFMKSAGDIGFFLEDGAQDAQGRLKYEKAQCVNKLGHAIHDLDPLFTKFSYRPEYREILHDLGYKAPSIVQSMYIMKNPHIGGEVKMHQDNSYIITEPLSCIGLWVAIEDAYRGNACLWAHPGSHLHGTKTYWAKEGQNMRYSEEVKYDTESEECIEVPAGSVVLLHGDLVHWSDINSSDKSRHAYTLHVVETDHVNWSHKNWLQRPVDFPFRPWPLA